MADKDKFNDPLQMSKIELDEFNDALDMSSKRLKVLQDATEKGIKQISKSLSAISPGQTSLDNLLKPLEKGLSVAAKEFDERIIQYAESIGRGGTLANKAAEYFIKAVNEFRKSMPGISDIAKESEKQAKTWHEFTEYGGIGVKGLKDISDQYPRTLLSLEKFQSTITSNAEALAQYGGTLEEGAESFSSVQTALANTTDGLRNLGFTVDSMADAATNYMSIQAKSGRQQRLQGEEMAIATTAYIKDLDLLSKLTGASNKELQKQQESFLRESRYGAAIRNLEREGTDTTNIQAIVAYLDKKAPDIAKGFRDALAGNLGTPESGQANMALVGGLTPLINKAKSGASVTDLMKQVISQVTPEQRKFIDAMQARGGSSALAPSAGYELQNISLTTQEDIDAVVKAQQKQAEQQDDRTKAQVSMEKDLQQAASYKIDAETAFANTLTQVGDVLSSASKGFYAGTKWFYELIGQKPSRDIEEKILPKKKLEITPQQKIEEANIIERKKARTVADLTGNAISPQAAPIESPTIQTIPDKIGVDSDGLTSAVKQFREGVDQYTKSTQRFQESSDANEKSVTGQTRNGTPYGPITYEGKVVNPGEPRYNQATEALKLKESIPSIPQTMQAPDSRPIGRPWAKTAPDAKSSELLNQTESTTTAISEMPVLTSKLIQINEEQSIYLKSISGCCRTNSVIMTDMYAWMLQYQKEFRTAMSLDEKGEKKGIFRQAIDTVGATANDLAEGAKSVWNAVTGGSSTGPQTVAPTGAAKGLGETVAKYESGGKGTNTVGYDTKGGTSYGKYQIASKTGTFSSFLKFLEKTDPAAAQELRSAGDANTGSSKGAAVDAWKRLASQGRLQGAEHEFIKQTHYDPAIEKAKKLGYDINDPRVQEMVWSGSIQHGNVGKVLQMGAGGKTAEEQVQRFYAARRKYVQGNPYEKALLNRYGQEEKDVLAMSTDRSSLQAASPQTARGSAEYAAGQVLAPTGGGKGLLSSASSKLGQTEENSRQSLTSWLNQYSGTKMGLDAAWCARFVNATLGQAGIKGTKDARASSFDNYGEKVWSRKDGGSKSGAQAGDIAVFDRKEGTGHVAFVKSIDEKNGTITVVGGNQGTKGGGGVTESTRSLKSLRNIRRAEGMGPQTATTPAQQAAEQVGPPLPNYAQSQSSEFVGPQTATNLPETTAEAPSMPKTIDAASLSINAKSVNVSGNQVANENEKANGEQPTNQTIDALNTIPNELGSTPIMPQAYGANTALPPTAMSVNYVPPIENSFASMQPAGMGLSQSLVANQSIGNDAALINQKYSPYGMNNANTITPDLGGILGGIFGSVTGNGPYRTRTPGRGSVGYGLGGLGQVLGGAIGSMKGLGGFGPVLGSVITGMGRGLGGMAGRSVTGTGYQTISDNSLGLPTGFGGPMQNGPDVLSGLGGMAGNMIGGTISGAAQGASGLFTGLSSMLGMGSSNLTAPASTTAPLEATPPQPKPAQEPTGAISPSDSNSGNEIMVSLMNTQIDQLSSLNSMTRKLNSTAEQILKSQK